jgi:hypothetical protein
VRWYRAELARLQSINTSGMSARARDSVFCRRYYYKQRIKLLEGRK